jgi:3-(3-hydroxy-phenyl)propionate hydroxylase
MARNDAAIRDNYDVLVAGAGTTGLALARLLTEHNVRLAVVDPNPIVCHHPRASHIDDEGVRLLQTLGLAAMEQTFMVMSGMEIFDPENQPLMHWEVVAGETDQGWQSDYQFFQPELEARLRGQLAMAPTADLWLGWQVTEVAQGEGSVTVTVRHRKTAETRVLHTAYLVGCDGANSRLRASVATGVADLEGTQQSVIIDVDRFTSLSGLPPTATVIKCGSRPFTHNPTAGGISRFQFMLIGEEDSESFEDPEVVYDLLAPYLPPDGYRILRTDVYDWHSVLVEGWRSGRLLIAGDAAHQMPPALGQGMISGLRDAANLAWKLAAVVRDGAGPELLDTYESERSPHVRNLIIESTRQAKAIAAAGRGDPVAATGVVDRGHGRLGTGLGGPDWPLRGELAPQPRNASGVRLDDTVGYRFAIAASAGGLDAVEPQTRRLWDRIGATQVTGFSPQLDDWLAAAGADAVIIRPDRYIFAACQGAEQLGAATRALYDEIGRREHVSL